MSKNEIKIFDNTEFGKVRTAIVNNEPLFCLVDVCKALEISNPSKVAQRLDEDERTKLELGRAGETNFVTESGLYAVILRSDKPNAKKFRKWVTAEVIPSIRKYGMYAKDELLDNPDLLLSVVTKLKEERDRAKELEHENAIMKPKAEFFDAVTDSRDAIDIGSVAKLLNHPNVGRNKLFLILRENKVLQQNNQPYQKYIDCGYFRVIEQKYEAMPGEIRINIKTLVFQKGVDFIKKLLDKVA